MLHHVDRGSTGSHGLLDMECRETCVPHMHMSVVGESDPVMICQDHAECAAEPPSSDATCYECPWHVVQNAHACMMHVHVMLVHAR